MKKRNVVIGAILSLISIGQPLIIKSGVVLSTTGLMLAFPQKVNAKSADKYFDIAYEMGNTGNYKGAIKNYTKVIELEPDNYIAYMNRGWNKANLGDDYAAIFLNAFFGLKLSRNIEEAKLCQAIECQ